MTEVSRNYRNIFLAKIPPILKVEVGFFSVQNFSRIFFPKYSTFFSPKLHFCKFEKKSENIFGSSSSFIHSFRLVVWEVQVWTGLEVLSRPWGWRLKPKSGLGLSNFFFFFFSFSFLFPFLFFSFSFSFSFSLYFFYFFIFSISL